ELLKSAVPRRMGAQNGPAIIATKTRTRSPTLIESGTWLVAVHPENKQPSATGQRHLRNHVLVGHPGESPCEPRQEAGINVGSPSRIAPSASFTFCMRKSCAVPRLLRSPSRRTNDSETPTRVVIGGGVARQRKSIREPQGRLPSRST